MGVRRWCLGLLLVQGLLSLPLARAEEEAMALYLELVLNGMPTGQVLEVQTQGDELMVTRGALRDAGVPIDGEADGQVSLGELEGVTARYEQALQQLLLTVPLDWLPEQRLGRTRETERSDAVSSFGALVNYDLFYSNTDSVGGYVSAWSEQRLFGGLGTLSNTGVLRHTLDGPPGRDGYFRFDTTWRYNDQARLLSYSAGDMVTGALSWNSAVRMGGVQLSRNFALRPDLITYPLPSFSGGAAVPSTVDLFINNAKVDSATLQPGPFTFDTLPLISGAGQATVVTTDVQGRQVSTSVPFYVTNTLLRKGLTDFSFSLGKLRQGYGEDSFAYGRSATSGTFRYGLFDSLTLESHAEAASGLALGGLGTTVALGHFGELTTSATQSRYLGTAGHQLSMGYSYFARRFGVSAQRVQRSRGYADLAVEEALDARPLDPYLAQVSDQLTFTISPPQIGSIGLGYFASRIEGGTSTRLLNLSWSRTLWRNLNVYASINRIIGESGISAQAQFSVPFDLLSTVTASIERDRSGATAERISYSRNVPSDGGVGWNLAMAHGRETYRQADLSWRNPFLQAEAGVYGTDNELTHWGDVSGSLVAMDGEVFAANRIDDAFVVVSTGGYADVPVRFEHQLLGRTNRDGHLLVPWVPSYYRGQFEIELLDLPGNVSASEPARYLSVQRGSGALLDFDLRQQLAAAVTLVDEQGAPLPTGLRVEQVGADTHELLGYDGQVYFEALATHNRLEVALVDGGRCQVEFDMPPQSDEIAQIGPLTCLRNQTP
ncbi:fimbria/pilus outer membrane usher protein [Stutzerimonas stutzeri]|nr:fimbria/pilus outer membrane usher protein [Stutzerimonas stutzeri]